MTQKYLKFMVKIDKRNKKKTFSFTQSVNFGLELTQM